MYNSRHNPISCPIHVLSHTLDEEKNGYEARDQLLYGALVKSWTHARSHKHAISAGSRGNKDQ